ncbi:MAG TPA: hypothetical protein VFB30_08590, partial [Spirochaetia bacterium]|nr:hypothetical protein [Spirochaetia bacterium]
MRKLLPISLLFFAVVMPIGAADLGGTWTPSSGAGQGVGLQTDGTLPAGQFALVTGPTADLEEISFDDQVVVRPLSGGVPEYHGYPLPASDSSGSHVLAVRMVQSPVVSSPPVLMIVPLEGLAARIALLNLP